MKDYKKVAEYCRALGSGELNPIGQSAGLCYSVLCKFKVDLDSEVDFSRYPNFSGDDAYPINSMCEETAHHMYSKRIQWVGAYGDERREFCLWVADELGRLHG